MVQTRDNSFARRRAGLTSLLGMLALLTGCQPKAAPPVAPTEAPAKVASVAREDQLNTIVLTPAAEERLAITTTAIASRHMPRFRTFGGEIALPPGASIVVSAPLGGTLQSPTQAGVPRVGSLVTAKQPVFLLLPLLSPEREVLTPAERIRFAEARNAVAASRIDAAGQVQQAEVQVEAARIALGRAERLLRDEAGTARAVDDAKAQLELANKTLEAAQSRKRLLDNLKLEEEAGKLTPLVIESPQAGMIRVAQAAAGELVAPGAPLFEVMRFDPIWVKTPVYVGESAELATDQPAQISGLAAPPGAEMTTARPVAAPPTAVALASTVDLYFELDNPRSAYRPGQRVGVRLKLTGEDDVPVVPWSAVMHDYYGGAWVYERTAPQTYVRRRVEVRDVVGDLAVLASGPAAGAMIVTAGAVELFGTEFGFAK